MKAAECIRPRPGWQTRRPGRIQAAARIASSWRILPHQVCLILGRHLAAGPPPPGPEKGGEAAARGGGRGGEQRGPAGRRGPRAGGQHRSATLRHEVEAALQQTGNPALSPDSLRQQAQGAGQAAAGGASNHQVAQEISDQVSATAGEVSRDDLTTVIAARTGMDRAEVERAADRVQTAIGSARQQVSQAAGQVQQQAGETAEQAANTTSKAMWGALLLMGLSGAAAAFGAGSTARE